MPSRRAFLTGTAAAAVASALPVSGVAMDAVKRAGPTRLRVGLAAYSMRQYLQPSRGRRQPWICPASSTGRPRWTRMPSS
jgi:hypothetical protein